MPKGDIPRRLADVQAVLGHAFHYPGNLGIEFRSVPAGCDLGAGLLAMYLVGVADDALIQARVTEPLLRHLQAQPAPLRPEVVLGLVPAPRLRVAAQLREVVQGILDGATALLGENWQQAVLVDTASPPVKPLGESSGETPAVEMFTRDLMANLAKLRTRLRDPNLIAEPLHLPGFPATGSAMVFLHGTARPELLDRVRAWLATVGGEEYLRRGGAAGKYSWLGVLPDVLYAQWVEKAAALLGAGYVLVLMNQLPYACVVPVTLPALLFGALDAGLRRPLAIALRYVRLLIAGLVLIGTATLVALFNYHQEMMPTPFLLMTAAGRENAPLPVLFELTLLEILQELVRELGFHLPLRFAPGIALLAGKVLVLILTIGGFIGPLQAVVTMSIALLIVGLLPYGVLSFLRVWRVLVLIGAGVFGFFGLAAVVFICAMYLNQASSFGVPFLGEPGLRFAPPSPRIRKKGGVLGARRFDLR